MKGVGGKKIWKFASLVSYLGEAGRLAGVVAAVPRQDGAEAQHRHGAGSLVREGALLPREVNQHLQHTKYQL